MTTAAVLCCHSPSRAERLVALARLDAAVRYFDPVVATRPSSWDSLFANNALRIADAPGESDYRRLVGALLAALHPRSPAASRPQRALLYDGFPPQGMGTSGGYTVRLRRVAASETYRVDMGEHVYVDVPISEGVADTTATLESLLPPDSRQWRAAYPSVGYRVLAAARIWSTIRLFYPYKGLLDEKWDDRLREALLAFEGARDSLDYATAVAHFVSYVHDTHVTVNSVALSDYLGTFPIGAAARLIENHLVVTRITDSSAARAGLQVGDIVLSIDGEPTAQRIARLTPLFSVSTQQSLRDRLEFALLNGRDATPARLIVRGVASTDRTLIVPRDGRFAQLLERQRDGSIVRMLPGNIGYIDLDRLQVSMVDSAFRMLARTTAIVLDDRGYPLGTAWAIAPRLNVHADPTPAARYKRLIVISPDIGRSTTREVTQRIPASNGVEKYSGKTVMLVDERTGSQAEHTGLFFEAANGTTFIGSPTMGVNGDVTAFVIPGEISITFTGQSVEHADGRQLQGVGLLPEIPVSPSISGIRAGRDEVLEKAISFLGGNAAEIPVNSADRGATTATPLATPAMIGWDRDNANSPYDIGLDRAVAHGGESSGHIVSREPASSSFGSFSQLIKADDYRGKRVRFAAYVKTREVTSTQGGAGLVMRVDGRGGLLAFDNMMNRPRRGTTGWTFASVILDVPQDADGLYLGFLLMGSGEAWIDDASLEIVGADVPSTNLLPPTNLDASNVERMRRLYSGLPSAPTNLGFEARR